MLIFQALSQSWKQGYSLSKFRADLVSGITVGIVAIPLGMALSIAIGVPPQHGLYTVIVAGFLAALLGGHGLILRGQLRRSL